MFAIGELILVGMAYFVRDWRTLTFLTCTLFVPFLVGAKFALPESVRWLLAQGEQTAATRLLQKIAEVNRTQYPASLVLDPPAPRYRRSEGGSTASNRDTGDESEGDTETGGIKVLFTQPTLRTRELVMMLSWICCSLLYYGFSAASSELSGNRYQVGSPMSAYMSMGCVDQRR